MPIATLNDLNKDDDEGGGGIPGDAMTPIDGEKLSKKGPGGIYHEKQIGGLCAVHALNNLLQASIFNEVQLAEIAHELDAQERAATGGAGLGDAVADGGSGNVRADGFFSVQVIVCALQQLGLTCAPLGAESAAEARAHPEREVGFICNRSEHWFPIRRLGGHWFDCNSMKAAPVTLSATHLSMYLEHSRQQGYSVFVVRGSYPAAPLESDPRGLEAAASGCREGATGHVSGGGGGGGGGNSSAPPSFNAFSGGGNSLGGTATSGGGGSGGGGPPEIDPELLRAAESDPELAEAIAMSMQMAENAPASAAPAKTAKDDADEIRRKRLARFG